MKKMLAFLWMILLSLGTFACDQNKTRYEAEFLTLFDTVSRIVAYTDSKETFQQYSQIMYDSLKEYNDLYDIYHEYDGINNLKTINDQAGIAPVKVDRRIIDLLLFAEKMYRDTHGKMNIALGSVLSIWHDHRTRGLEDPDNAEAPSLEELQAAAKHTDIEDVVIDEAASTVFLRDPEMSLDVGAIGKGYAVEQVCQMAMQKGFAAGLISVGGNVRAIGSKGGEQPWNVGIENTDKESQDAYLHIIYIKNLSVVTSGDYERYYYANGQKYHHIIDPDTLFPSAYFTAVTILCQDSGLADALSTAVFNMPYEEGRALIDALPGVEALWVFKDGEIKYSADFKQYLEP